MLRNMYLDQSKELVFDLPGIGFKLYNANGFSDVSLEDIKGRNKILVTYRDTSEINNEIMQEEIWKNAKILYYFRPLFLALGLGGAIYTLYSDNLIGLAAFIPGFIHAFLLRRKFGKIKKINMWNYFEQFYIDPVLEKIHHEFKKTNDFKKTASIARDNGMGFIAKLYEKQ